MNLLSGRLRKLVGASQPEPDIDDFLACLLNGDDDGARDDAAMAIGRSPDAEWAQRALIYACWSPKLNDWLRENVGEYLAQIWLGSSDLMDERLDGLPSAARKAADTYIAAVRRRG